MPGDEHHRLRHHLLSGESITWSGRPVPAAMALRRLPFTIISLLLAGVVMWMFAPHHTFPPLSELWPLSHQYGGLYFIGGLGLLFASTPLTTGLSAARTVYAVTDQRALVLRGGKLFAFPADSLPGVVRFARLGGVADLVFMPPQTKQPGIRVSTWQAPKPLDGKGQLQRGSSMPDGFRGIRNADAAEACLQQLMVGRADALKHAKAVPLDTTGNEEAKAAGDDSFRTVTHPTLGFSIDAPPGNITFNSSANMPGDWQWNFLDMMDRDGGPRITLQVEPATSNEAEQLHSQLVAGGEGSNPGPAELRRGPDIDGMESYELDSILGSTRGRQILLYRDGVRYTIQAHGPLASPSAEALFRRVATSLQFGGEVTASNATSVAPTTPAAKVGPMPELGGFVTAVLVGMATIYFDFWLLAPLPVYLLWRNRFLSGGMRAALAVVLTLPHIIVAVCRHFMPGRIIELEPSTLATSAHQWALPYFCLIVAALLYGVGRATGRGRTVTAGSRVPDILSGKRARIVFNGMAVFLLAVGLLSAANLSDDFERVEILPDGHWSLVHTFRGTVATVTPAQILSITDQRKNSPTRTTSGSYWEVTLRLVDGRAFKVETYSLRVPEAVAALNRLRGASG